MEQDGFYHYQSPGQTEPPKPQKKKPSFHFPGKTIALVIIALAVLLVAQSCFYTVDDKQQAVVTTFGKVTGVTDAGVHFRLPLGIQQVEKVDVNVYQKIELGYSTKKTVTMWMAAKAP